MTDHWDQHARAWKNVGPPLRPSSEDVEVFERRLQSTSPDNAPLRVLLLGVTPELARLRLPEGSSLTAVERNRHMIEHVWPEDTGHAVREADWRELPFDAHSMDVVLGDGCFTTLTTPSEYQAVVGEVSRVLSPNGRFLHRFFVRPPEKETTESVLQALDRGEMSSLEIFKWRFAMSLVDSDSGVVPVAHIWSTLTKECGADLERVQVRGFGAESVKTLEHYKGSDKSYSFPRLGDVPRWIGSALHLEQTLLPSYELGERCPITVWEKSLHEADAASPPQR